MAYSEELAERIRSRFATYSGLTERKMFGGLCFLLNGNMCFGIVGEKLMVRVGAEGQEEAFRYPHVHPMDFTGRPMKGMIYVAPEGTLSERDLAVWVERGLRHTQSLPAKVSSTAARKRSAPPGRKSRRTASRPLHN